ncbi:hypothetical protein SODALDRAFT_359015 [Sodiomyces alkalinus F11]|uniref:Uncharacterized protein n=1 Tax=Sodiomyces alkalinus (strain CBS 110278 / VKM F-3762 / F11) TaxID=1314773 RepID=A0A3N2PXE7_SODAK|nr:hypothetical protein SODALDRAFT_359015 [Sodiomyces alkalinus F11]ROT39148.1 hypothetical protein SODALDRAFT_359015 [Sodiomyces alkalinus F11]
MMESRAGWGRLRQLNINKILALVKAPSTTVEHDGKGAFCIIHTPDRPVYPTPATLVPTDDECMRFLEAFRSPKKFGWDDDDDDDIEEEDPKKVTGANMAEWKPYPPLKDFPRPPQTARTNVIRAEQTKPGRRSIVPCGTGNQQQPHATIADEKSWNDGERRNESMRGNPVGGVATLEDAQTRLRMLASHSHRKAARWSDQSQDSGYEELPWCRGPRDTRPKVTIPTHQPQSPQSTTEPRSRWSLSPHGPREHCSPLAMHCQQDDNIGKNQNLSRGESSENADHIAYSILATSEDEEKIAPSPSCPVLPPLGKPSEQLESTQSPVEAPEQERRRITSGFQDWQTPEQREEFERNIEVYGDWAEYYFQTDNFEDNRHSEKRKKRRSPGEATISDTHTARSLETVWEDMGPDTPDSFGNPNPWFNQGGVVVEGEDSSRRLEGEPRLESGTLPDDFLENEHDFFNGDTTGPSSRTLKQRGARPLEPESGAIQPSAWVAEGGIPRGFYLENDGLDLVRIHQTQNRLQDRWKPPPHVKPRRPDVFYEAAWHAILNKPLPVNPGLGGMI